MTQEKDDVTLTIADDTRPELDCIMVIKNRFVFFGLSYFGQ
jgi:hypothetical protein